jgi:excinuclease ABC subunit C
MRPDPNTLPESLQLKLTALPQEPGVYFLKNAQGKVVYIGKAKSLRARVRTYFQDGYNDGRPQYAAMVNSVADIDFLVTRTEQEALVLEATQIREFKPRYNINLKDDKKYPVVRITKETYPRVVVTRDIVEDGSRYLGPFSNVGAMRTALDLMHKIFPVRSCKYNLPQKGVTLCMDYHIKRCEGPCEDLVSISEYRATVNRAVRFLKGHNAEVIRELQERMKEAAEKLNYERAARCRDQISALETVRNRQKVITAELVDRDVVGLSRQDDEACCCVLEIREGRLLGQKLHILGGVMSAPDAEVLSAFLRQFYLHTESIPHEIHLPCELEDLDEMSAWLSARSARKLNITAPQRGDKLKPLEIATRNAEQALVERQLKREQRRGNLPQSVHALQRDLGLGVLPRRIEAVDISNFQGSESVGSLVVFVDGKPRRSDYRMFKIKTVEGADDFASIREVVGRRFRRLQDADLPLPDLLLVDGGKGQLSSAVAALRDLGADAQPVIGLAKRLDEVIVPGASDTLYLPRNSASLRLLQTLRDEAHRFALTRHRQLRRKRTLASALDDIPGVGEKRKEALLRQLGSLKRIREASTEELSSVPSISPALAQVIAQHLAKSP